jgi:hypothetical protein
MDAVRGAQLADAGAAGGIEALMRVGREIALGIDPAHPVGGRPDDPLLQRQPPPEIDPDPLR